MKPQDIIALMDAIAPAILAQIDKTVAPLRERLKKAEDALAALPEPMADGQVNQLIDKTIAPIIERLQTIPTAEDVAALVPKPKDGVDGLSIDYDAVKQMVVAALPPPLELPFPLDCIVSREQVGKLVADAIETAKPKDGVDGKSVDPAAVEQMVADAVAKAVVAPPTAEAVAALVPAPKDGVDGKDVDPAAVEQMVADAVAKAVVAPPTAEEVAALVPVPKDGVDGKDVELPVIQQMIDNALVGPIKAIEVAVAALVPTADAVAALVPVPKNGMDGKDVDPAQIEEVVAKAIALLPKPKDGVGLSDALIDKDGALAVTMTDGRVVKLGKVVGDPGKDGLGDGDISVIHDGGRGFKFVLQRGEHKKEFAFSIPVVLDRGVYKSELEYEHGDGVTSQGSFWIAQTKTMDRPGTSEAWRLAVKKGRDGKGVDTASPRTATTVKLK